MTVPDFQSWFLPLLKRIGDGELHKMSDLYEELAKDLRLSDHDRAVMLPSGKQVMFENRIGWARTYLKKAGLLESPGRGVCRITQRGRDTLASKPSRLNIKLLERYPEFVDFHKAVPKAGGASTAKSPSSESDETPEETLERVHEGIKEQLVQELLERIKAAPPSFFERLVVELLLLMGYGGSREDAGRTVGKSGDGGIDGVINEDRLGLDMIYLQAKRWESTVGRPVVQAFIGSLEGVRANKGVMITTSQFSADARSYVGQIGKKIVLIDGEQLANLMVEHNLGISVVTTYDVKKVDSDYFES
ncbi:MAG: restriction endonuclease [Gemmatimonadota bacterium]|nr:restriction endonuclease [Gemmatimonadota bacterium]